MSASATPLPRVLLVEDDPVSRAFLQAAAEGLPAHVDAAADCAEAARLAADRAFDAWLIDANLPDGNGADLLARLRRHAPATPALAHTASALRSDLEALVAAGFAEVLVKPFAAALLQGALRRVLGAMQPDADAVGGKLPCWDDVAALAALRGEAAHVDALRRLFLGELETQRLAIASALGAGRHDEARQVLHRLRASCGFTGAARLDAAVRALEADPASPLALRRFEEAASDLFAAAEPASR